VTAARSSRSLILTGRWQLTDEPIDAPVKALAAARMAAGIAPERFRVLQPGEVWTL
jgi:hypothetical protein